MQSCWDIPPTLGHPISDRRGSLGPGLVLSAEQLSSGSWPESEGYDVAVTNHPCALLWKTRGSRGSCEKENLGCLNWIRIFFFFSSKLWCWGDQVLEDSGSPGNKHFMDQDMALLAPNRQDSRHCWTFFSVSFRRAERGDLGFHHTTASTVCLRQPSQSSALKVSLFSNECSNRVDDTQ